MPCSVWVGVGSIGNQGGGRVFYPPLLHGYMGRALVLFLENEGLFSLYLCGVIKS